MPLSTFKPVASEIARNCSSRPPSPDPLRGSSGAHRRRGQREQVRLCLALLQHVDGAAQRRIEPDVLTLGRGVAGSEPRDALLDEAVHVARAAVPQRVVDRHALGPDTPPELGALLLEPTSVAVIGASRDPSSIGGRLLHNLLSVKVQLLQSI